MTAFFSALARLAVRRTRTLAIAWLLVVVVAAAAASQLEQKLQVGGFNLPGTEFSIAADILADDLRISSDRSAVVVYRSETLRVTDKEFADAVNLSLRRLAGLDSVTKVESFYNPGLPPFVSEDNHTTYALVTLRGSENDLQSATPELRELAQAPPLETHLVGNAAVNYDVQEASAEDLVKVERFTLPIIAVLLVLVFGSAVAAAVPLVMGVASVAVALAVVYLLALVSDVSIFALNIGTMIGLALAIDFSLIMVSRFREELCAAPLEVALDRTLQTAGRSIAFSGITLTLTMAVLALFPVMVIGSVALAIAVVGLAAIVTGLLLLPVVLVSLHRHLDRWNLRARLPFLSRGGGGWHRTIERVMRRPAASIALALCVLGLLAAPAVWAQVRGVTVDALPSDTESRHAVELVQAEFGDGELAPIFVVVQAPTDGGIWTPSVLQGVLALHQSLERDPRVDHVQSLATIVPNPSDEFMASLSPATIETSPDRTRIAKRLSTLDGRQRTTAIVVYPRAGPAEPETEELVLDLRRNAKAWAPGLAPMHVLIGGEPAQHHDFLEVVYDQFPILLALSLLVTYVVLMVFFHSLLLPLLAIALNVISLLASLGALVLVFQWGIGDSLLGFDSLGALQGYTPVMLFSVLFALSTDYQVFVLTRVREHIRRGLSNDEAIAAGVEQTAGIITAAGLIMVVVFGSFAFTGVLVIKEIGFGLAVAVAIDVLVVRVVLMPAAMKLLGRWNWWMPRALDRIVPEIDEGGFEPAPATPPATA